MFNVQDSINGIMMLLKVAIWQRQESARGVRDSTSQLLSATLLKERMEVVNYSSWD